VDLSFLEFFSFKIKKKKKKKKARLSQAKTWSKVNVRMNRQHGKGSLVARQAAKCPCEYKGSTGKLESKVAKHVGNLYG
jgi:hypothetical protein